MRADEIRDLLRRDRFQPFRFKLTSGDSFAIRDPNTLALGRHRAFVVWIEGEVDRWTAFPHLHIANLESLETASHRKEPPCPRHLLHDVHS